MKTVIEEDSFYDGKGFEILEKSLGSCDYTKSKVTQETKSCKSTSMGSK